MGNIKHKISTLQNTILKYEKIKVLIREKPEGTTNTWWHKNVVQPQFFISKRTYDRVVDAPIGSMKRELEKLKQQENDSTL